MESGTRVQTELIDAIERAEASRTALASLDTSLTANLDKRQEMMERIDSELNNRQIQLVTDILRAEVEHRSLTEAVDSIQSTVDAMRKDLADTVGGESPDQH